MASFSTFKTLAEALVYFNISEQSKNLFPNLTTYIEVPAFLAEELEFNITEMPYNASEAAICEMVIFPILKSIWKPFAKKLLLWSHQSVSKDAEVSGIPDYILAKRSPLGRVMSLPMLVMIEAKKDNFDEGWGQCVAQMIAAQKLNNDPYVVYGIVTNGDTWQFGYLESQHLFKHFQSLSLSDLQKLYNTLHFVFKECEKQIG
ncbi:MAG: hypothetical protein ACKVTZ_02160 [Bacteroidia bacterium]